MTFWGRRCAKIGLGGIVCKRPKERSWQPKKNTHRTHLPLDKAAGAKALPNANKVSTERTSKLVRMVGPGMTAVMVGLRAKRKSMRHVKVSITSSRLPRPSNYMTSTGASRVHSDIHAVQGQKGRTASKQEVDGFRQGRTPPYPASLHPFT